MTTALPSSIRDNHHRGNVGDFLREKIQGGSKLSFVFAYFTIYAYDVMREHLESVDSLRFLFGEPRFVRHEGHQRDSLRKFGFAGLLSVGLNLIY